MGRLLRWLITAGFVAVLVYYTAPRPKSFTVSASVETLRVETVNEGSPDWELPVIEACLRVPGNANAPAAVGDPIYTDCQSSRYVRARIVEPALRWSEGYTLSFQGMALDHVRILVRKAESAAPVNIDGFEEFDRDWAVDREITDGTILFIPWLDTRLQERPVLRLTGRVRIGEVPAGSDALILREGRYEIRQNLGLNPRPVVVSEGTLVPGDRVGFAPSRPPVWQRWVDWVRQRRRSEEDLIATLFLTDLSRFTPAFDVVATTRAEYSALRLTRIGVEPTLIPVTWTERLRADAIPVGISTLIGLLAGMLALANTYFKAPSEDRKTKP